MDEVTKALKFGDQVENIAAFEGNPIKYGIFIRRCGSKMAEYATDRGCHSTPIDNLRLAAQSAAPVGEPVAWQYRHSSFADGAWIVGSRKPVGTWDEIRPLYTAPQSPSGSPVGWGDDYPKDQS